MSTVSSENKSLKSADENAVPAWLQKRIDERAAQRREKYRRLYVTKRSEVSE